VVDVLTDLLNDAKGLVLLAITLAAIWFTAWTWVRTRSIVPTLSALLLGALVLWGVNNYTGLREQVDEDFNRYSVDGPPGAG
jgi:hypothetical protein